MPEEKSFLASVGKAVVMGDIEQTAGFFRCRFTPCCKRVYRFIKSSMDEVEAIPKQARYQLRNTPL